jgi:C4-dicarboxylate-specific signal transduction histidine kinase
MIRLSHLSIRAKVLIIVAGTLIIANFISTMLVRDLVYRYAVGQKLATADILAASFVHDVKNVLDVNQQGTTQDIIAKYTSYYRNIRQIAFFDPTLHDVADSEPTKIGTITTDPDILEALRAARPSTRTTRVGYQDFSIRSVSPILRGSKITGAAVIYLSVQDITETIAKVDRSIIILQVAITVVVCLALYVLIRQIILLRLNRLIDATHQIARGEYDVALPDRPADEIAELATALNRMSADLKRSRQELDNYNRHLEAMVREQTATLQQTYEDLKNAQSHLVLNEKMASLGVLIAGIAHEINTPVGAILNVSRNLARMLATLPASLRPFWHSTEIAPDAMASCLEDLRLANSKSGAVSSYRDAKRVETLLVENGVPESRRKATVLARLSLTEASQITPHLDCLRDRSFLQLAEAYGSIAQGVAITETSSQKISEIVRALKYYARSDMDRMDPIQVNDSIQVALVLLRNQLKSRVSVVTNLAADLPPVLGTGEMNQIWTNLLTNACDAIEDLGPDSPGEVEIRTWRDGDLVLTSVTDNGVGIPADKLEKVFDPFYTTKDIGKGTGLGLSIVSGIVKKLGGTVSVTSRPGCTTFQVALLAASPEIQLSGDDEIPPVPEARPASVSALGTSREGADGDVC